MQGGEGRRGRQGGIKGGKGRSERRRKGKKRCIRDRRPSTVEQVGVTLSGEAASTLLKIAQREIE